MAFIRNAKLQGNAWAAHDADIVGNVTIGDESSVWYHAVIRGDMAPIIIGSGTNVQDGSIIHADTGHPCHIGNSVSIGHGALVHGCTIGNNTLIGMGAIVLNGAEIGEDCIIGAGALVTQGMKIPDGMMAFGSPAKIIRPLTEEEKKENQTNAIAYMLLKNVQPE